MSVTIVIPARFASSRYPGKPLVALRGATGQARTLLARTIAAGRQAAEALAATGETVTLLVATDDARIADAAGRAGAEVVLTSPACRNGTERVAEAVAIKAAGAAAGAGAGTAAGAEGETGAGAGVGTGTEAGAARTRAPRIVVNLQGDAPLTPPAFVTALVAALDGDPTLGMATPVLRCDERTVAALLADRRAGRVGATTAVFDRAGRALYFSKEVLPFTSGTGSAAGGVPVFHHVGLYAYRPWALAAYAGWEPGPLEQVEGLEQLRFLENGQAVAAVTVTAAEGAGFWELNNPSDVPLIEAHLRQMGIA